MKVEISWDKEIPLTAKDLARLIENSLSHLPYPLDITVNPDHVDIQKGKTFSDIELGGELYTKLAKIAKNNEIPIEQVLRRGMDKMKLKGEL